MFAATQIKTPVERETNTVKFGQHATYFQATQIRLPADPLASLFYFIFVNKWLLLGTDFVHYTRTLLWHRKCRIIARSSEMLPLRSW
jgi:hypothetical protein